MSAPNLALAQPWVRKHSSRLLALLAPYEPVVDQLIDGADERSFWTRLHDADMRRSHDPSTWLSTWRKGRQRYVEVTYGWQALHWGLGIDIDGQQATRNNDGELWVVLMLGPCSIVITVVVKPRIGASR